MKDQDMMYLSNRMYRFINMDTNDSENENFFQPRQSCKLLSLFEEMLKNNKEDEIEKRLSVYKDVPIDQKKLNPFGKPNFPFMASYDVLPDIEGIKNALIRLIEYCNAQKKNNKLSSAEIVIDLLVSNKKTKWSQLCLLSIIAYIEEYNPIMAKFLIGFDGTAQDNMKYPSFVETVDFNVSTKNVTINFQPILDHKELIN